MWKIVGTAAGILIAGWLSWMSLVAVGAVSEEEFDKRKEAVDKKFEKVQERIEDKLDKIQETILDLHKE